MNNEQTAVDHDDYLAWLIERGRQQHREEYFAFYDEVLADQ